MAQLAIKGHPTRGKEVIEILEMLGGIDYFNLTGAETDGFYYIYHGNNKIYHCLDINTENVIIYNLEEFEEKFPYKVGDKVYNIIHNENQTITEVVWDFQEDEIVYQTNNNDYLFVNYLQPYEEENYCQVIGNDTSSNGVDTSSNGVDTSASSINEETMEEPEPKAPILSNRYDYAEGKCGYVIPDGYEFDSIKEGFQTEIILKPKKPIYPKYYTECEASGLSSNPVTVALAQGVCMGAFAKLIVIRNTYWEIAGEQLGLDKPWKPDWTDLTQKYCILCRKGKVDTLEAIYANKILAFPTAEMRDTFYENFKDLIEQCKELL